MGVPTHSAYERRIKRHLQKQRRQAARAGATQEVAKLEAVLGDADKFQVLCEQIISDSEVPTDDLEVNFFETGPYGVISGLLAMLVWLLANWDSVLKMIDKIIERFSNEIGEQFVSEVTIPIETDTH